MLGQVAGKVWATKKSEALTGQAFLTVEVEGRLLVCADCVGAGEGETVLVLKSGADGEELWVAGVPNTGEISPGEVRIQSRQAAVFLGNDGSIDLRGTVKINGTPIEELFEPKVKEEGGLG